ncbi:MAG TPA: cellulase family glycosylhydrolase [Thermoleophilaceae bacterium]
MLHGLNMVSKLAPYEPAATGFGADDAAFLARNGFNVVRLGVIYAGVEPSPGQYDDAYLANVAATVRQLAKRGIYTLLDFHQDQYNERFHGEGFPAWAVQDDGLPNQPDLGFPGNYLAMAAVQHAFDHFWADSPGPGGVGLQERYSAAWAHVASRFASNTHVLGYDLFNEPWPGTNYLPCATPAGCPAFDAQLGSFESKAIGAIRGTDKRHLVWYEPDVLFNGGSTTTKLPKFRDRRLGMSFHDYCLGGPQQTCEQGEKGALTNAVARSQSTGDGLLLTEFGATSDASVTTRIANDADAAMMPWVEWAYCGCGDPTTSANPPSSQALVVDPKQPPRGANVMSGDLRALDRPYPQVVAGTPQSFAFDPSSAAFSLTYSTARAGGHGRFKPGACTRVFVPSLQYPHGYSAHVSGARVISKRGAGLLELAAKRGARRVRVSVMPAKKGHTRAPRVTKSCR